MSAQLFTAKTLTIYQQKIVEGYFLLARPVYVELNRLSVRIA